MWCLTITKNKTTEVLLHRVSYVNCCRLAVPFSRTVYANACITQRKYVASCIVILCMHLLVGISTHYIIPRNNL